jgi:hypothetical protein
LKLSSAQLPPSGASEARHGEFSGFADLQDPRRGNAQRRALDEIVMVALLAMVSGAETCVGTALFGRSKEALLRRFLRLPGGILNRPGFCRRLQLLRGWSYGNEIDEICT